MLLVIDNAHWCDPSSLEFLHFLARQVHGARVLVVLVEGPAPQVMDAEAEYDHLEGISLLSAGLSPGIEHVIAVIEVTQSTAGEMRSTAGEISPFIEWFTPMELKKKNTRKPASLTILC